MTFIPSLKEANRMYLGKIVRLLEDDIPAEWSPPILVDEVIEVLAGGSHPGYYRLSGTKTDGRPHYFLVGFTDYEEPEDEGEERGPSTTWTAEVWSEL